MGTDILGNISYPLQSLPVLGCSWIMLVFFFFVFFPARMLLTQELRNACVTNLRHRVWQRGSKDRCSELPYGNWRILEPGQHVGLKIWIMFMSWNLKMWRQSLVCPLLQINFHKNLHLFVLCSFPYTVIQFLTLDQTFEVSKLSSSGKLMVPRRIIVFWSLGVCQSTSLKPRTVITVWWATGTPSCALENHESGDEAQDVRFPFGRISVVNLNGGPCVLGFFVALLVSSWRHAQAE